MLFSVNYKSKHVSVANEIRTPHNQLGRIFETIKKYPEKRYVIQIADDADIVKVTEQVEFIKEITSNYTLECDRVDMMRSYISNGYNAFLKFPVAEWETFRQLQNVGVSDIYIDGPLGFQVSKLQLGKKDTLIRCSPTISPNASIDKRGPQSFFIRPEDLSLYDPAIDILDFHEPDQDKEDALFSIYKRGSFTYPINELVKGLSSDANNALLTGFAEKRLQCGQACSTPGRMCHICHNQLRFAELTYSFYTKDNKSDIDKTK